MGSPDKFSLRKIPEGIALGIFISRFPHALSINILLFKYDIYIGLGKGYDEVSK